MDKQNVFEAAEYERRIRKVRDAMGTRSLGSLLVTAPGNICYLTGYQTFGEAQMFLIVPSTGELIFILRKLESLLVAYTTWSGEVVTYEDSEDPVSVVVAAIREHGLGKDPIGVDEATGTLPPVVHRQIVHQLVGTEVRSCQGAVESARRVKSVVEIQACRVAARLTAIGMQAAVEASVPGSTENHVASAAAEAMTIAGSEWFANSPIVTAGRRSGIPHTTYARKALEPGDTVIIELGASYFRYFGPLMRTASIGPASAKVHSMHDACKEALEAAMVAIKPGITSGEAHDACQNVIDKRGYHDNFKKRLGYSVGIGFRSWSEGRFFDIKENDDRVIEKGMVIHMPPALRIPNVLGVGISETIVVTDDGCEALSAFPQRLFESA